jgi:hypothetical protein
MVGVPSATVMGTVKVVSDEIAWGEIARRVRSAELESIVGRVS